MFSSALENYESLKNFDKNTSFVSADTTRELERIARVIATVTNHLKSNLVKNSLQNHDEIYQYLLQSEQIQLVESKKFRIEWETFVLQKEIKAEIACYHYFEKLLGKLGRSFEPTLRSLRMELLIQLTLA